MRGSWLRVLLGAVVLAAAAVAFAPAALLDRPLALRTQDRLRLVDASGPWWHGRGAIATADGTARVPLAWRVDVTPLVRGTLAIRLVGGDAAPTGTVTMRDGSVDIRDLHVRVPAALIVALDPRLRPVALGGNVTIDAPSWVWRPTGYTGVVDATWDDARVVTGDTALALGTVSLTTGPAAERLAGTIRNTDGDLTIDGTFADRGGTLDAGLTLRPTATAPEIVRRMLPLLGAPDGSGGVRVTWRSDR